MRITPILRHLRSDGLRGFRYDLQALVELAGDRRRLPASAQTADRSSISDDDVFPLFCELASRDDAVFARFRRSALFMGILEHVSREQGAAYLQEARSDQDALDKLRRLLVARDVGGPRTYRFDGIGLASPTTLRYVKVATDLRRLFGDLNGLRVAEIGIGYGGQARVLNTVSTIGSYDLYDLPPILALARRFLDASGVGLAPFAFHDGRSPETSSPDLVISNYALSEIRREVQDAYLQSVVSRASRGYLTYNHISPPELNSYTADEIVALIPGAHTLPEVPLTHPDNVIIVWGDGTP
jgi:hypothetical protein